MLIKINLHIFSFFLFSFFTFGQNLSQKTSDDTSEIKQATKIDEFGDISEMDFAPRLREFAEIMRKNDSATGYVIFYNDFNATPFKKTQYFAKAKMRSYANYARFGYDSPRLVLVAGGLREKMTTQLWLVPSGEEVPTISGALNYAARERYKLDTLGTKNVNLDKASLILSEEEKAKSEDPEYMNFSKELAEVLKQDKTWRAVLFFYADKDEFDIQKSQKVIEDKIKVDFEEKKADLNQVKIIFGGYRRQPQIDIWIVPINGIEPEAMPDEKIQEN